MKQHDTITTLTNADEAALIAEDARHFPPDHPLVVAVGRTYSNIYSFWCLCDRSCRRAGKCVSDPAHCRDAFLPLISDAVHDEGQREFAARAEGLSFEEMLERWPEGLPNLWHWVLAVETRAGAPRPRRRPKVQAGTRA